MPPQSEPQTTYEQKLNIALFLAQLPAVTVMVLLRRNIGFRTLSSGAAVVLFALFFIGNPIQEGAFSATKANEETFPWRTALPPDQPVRPGWVGLFAAASLLAAGRQKSARRRDMKNGIVWHTYYRGDSIFSFLPLQASTVARFVDPAACIIAGFLSWHCFSVALGAWLIFAGLCLRFVEQWVYKQNFQRTLDAVDGLVESEVQAETVEQFTRGRSEQRPGPSDADGIPTGLAPDIQKSIEAKRAKRSRPPRL